MSWERVPQAPYMYAAGNVVVTTTAGGVATIFFGRTFPVPPVVVAMGGNGESFAIYAGGPQPTTSSVTLGCYNQAGTVLVNSAVRCLWQAFLPT